MKRWAWIGWVWLAALWPAGAQFRPQNGIAALVNDAVITFQEVLEHAAPALDLLRRTTPPEAYEQKRLETLTRALEDLVEKQLILDEFKAQGGMLPDSIIEDEIRERIRQSYGDRAKLTKTLQALGITYESFRRRTREEIIVNYMRAKHIAQAVLISPAKIEHYYATNLAQYKLGEQVKLRLIVLNAPPGSADQVRRRMGEILTKIEQGAPFGEMAGVYSEGSQRREQGDWGWVDRSVLNRGLSDVAFALQPGQHSGVLGLARLSSDDYWLYRYDASGRAISGRHYTGKDELVEEQFFNPTEQPPNLPAPQEFYLLKLEDRRPARTRSLEEVRDEIEKNLIALERARLQQRWLDRLKAKAFRRYF